MNPSVVATRFVEMYRFYMTLRAIGVSSWFLGIVSDIRRKQAETMCLFLELFVTWLATSCDAIISTRIPPTKKPVNQMCHVWGQF